jgi:hypothetical protein
MACAASSVIAWANAAYWVAARPRHCLGVARGSSRTAPRRARCREGGRSQHGRRRGPGAGYRLGPSLLRPAKSACSRPPDLGCLAWPSGRSARSFASKSPSAIARRHRHQHDIIGNSASRFQYFTATPHGFSRRAMIRQFGGLVGLSSDSNRPRPMPGDGRIGPLSARPSTWTASLPRGESLLRSRRRRGTLRPQIGRNQAQANSTTGAHPATRLMQNSRIFHCC